MCTHSPWFVLNYYRVFHVRTEYNTRYVHAYTQTSCLLALPVLETCGPLGVEGDLSKFPVGLLPVDCVVRVAVSVTVVGVVPNREA